MTDVSPLYHPTLVRHARSPGLRSQLEGARTFDGHNRTCGDRLALHLATERERLTVRFEGEGCALSLGSASALCEAVDGQAPAVALAIARGFLEALDADANTSTSLPGDLDIFLAVRAFPARTACVRLAADTLCSALDPVGGFAS